jgi:SET domain-containing protein
LIPGLIIRSSSIHAAGCYTTRPIRTNTRIVEYGGRRITKQEADELYTDRIVTYLFGVDGTNLVIDGYGTAMYINHSCAPNCETVEHRGKIWIKAIRDIAPGEELTYEYNLYDSDEDNCDCYCGAKNCRGTMYSADEVKRRARKMKREAEKKATAKKSSAKKKAA